MSARSSRLRSRWSTEASHGESVIVTFNRSFAGTHHLADPKGSETSIDALALVGVLM
jgi:hypothetical protein